MYCHRSISVRIPVTLLFVLFSLYSIPVNISQQPRALVSHVQNILFRMKECTGNKLATNDLLLQLLQQVRLL